jgi:hypothetical protein
MLSLAAVFFVIVATAAVSTGQTDHLLGAAPRVGPLSCDRLCARAGLRRRNTERYIRL